jgi:anti-sigma B factor antagonist
MPNHRRAFVFKGLGLKMLEFKREKKEDVVVLSLKGQLDALTAGTMKPVMDELISSHSNRVVFNLDELTLIDSSGVGAIVSIFKRSRAQGGDTKIAHLSKQPKEVFRLLRLDKALSIFDTVEQAIEAFKSSPPQVN